MRYLFLLILALIASPAIAAPCPASVEAVRLRRQPNPDDLEAARLKFYHGWEMRTPYLTGTSNNYHIGKNPYNKIEVLVQSWNEMEDRLCGTASVPAPVRDSTVLSRVAGELAAQGR